MMQSDKCSQMSHPAQVLGLTRPPQERRHFLQQVFRYMDDDQATMATRTMAESHALGGPSWSEVRISPCQRFLV